MLCKICGEEHPPLGFPSHLKFKHKTNCKDYYDDYCKIPNEDKCIICGKPTKFNTIVKGYQKTCSRECQYKYQNTDEYRKILAKGRQEAKTHKAGKNSVQKKIDAEKVIGNGKQSVYCYFYQIYKDKALANNETVWECKIGKATIDAQGRVIDQFGTAYPEYPVIALVIKCKSAHALEQAIHCVLDLRNRHIESSPGNEWYMTNPQEIEEIYNWMLQK